jgi:hypothetical protein
MRFQPIIGWFHALLEFLLRRELVMSASCTSKIVLIVIEIDELTAMDDASAASHDAE